MRNSKGFTLIELIVSIAIMGILLIIALPQVSKIKEENKDKKYEAYQNSIERASKLFMDSNSKDIFGYQDSGCYRVKYSELKNANLIKAFAEQDIVCSNDEETYVDVKKVLNEFEYISSLVCRNKNGNIVYPYPDYDANEMEPCTNEPDNDSPKIIITSDDKNQWINTSENELEVKIKIYDTMGLGKNLSIKYKWVNIKTNAPSKWYMKDFKNKGGIKETTINYTIPQANLPTDSGTYRLEVYPNKTSNRRGIVDYRGNEYNGYETLSSFMIDNTAPTVPTSTIRYDSSTGTVRTNSSSWTNKTLWWGDFLSMDNESGVQHYEYSERCTGEKSYNLRTSYTYTSNKNTTYCIRAVDNAGNISDWSEAYYFRIDKDAPSLPTSSINFNGHWMDANAKPNSNNSMVNITSFNNTGHSCSDIWWGNFNATDTGGSGISHYEYSDGCTGSKSNNLGSSYHYTTTWNHNYCIRSVDKAGNVSAWSNKYHIELTFDPCKCGATSGCNSNASSVCTSTTTYSSWSSCSVKCGSGGTKTRTKTTTSKCNGTTRTYKTTEKESCNEKACYNLGNDKNSYTYSVCPSDQLKATASECAANQKDKMNVSLSKTSGKTYQYLTVTVTVHMNKYDYSFNSSCPTRRVCIAKKGSNTCTVNLGSFDIGSRTWLGLNKVKTVVSSKSVKVSTLDKAKYRIVIDDNGCGSKIFRFRDDNTTEAFEVTINP